MTGSELKEGRLQANWTQQEAAKRFGLTQAYLSMLEGNHRPVTPVLSLQAQRLFDLSPVLLPLQGAQPSPLSDDEFKTELGAFAYPGFRYLGGKPKRNPAELLFCALDCEDLDRRVVEALPWLAFAFVNLDWDWLVTNAKIRDRQNRLGFVVELAKETAVRKGDVVGSATLSERLSLLRRSRLAAEDTLCHDSMTEAERKWLRSKRPRAAKRWNLLTDLAVKDLSYAQR
jgi:transcriptional regulator with XRE-family HTH domain